MFYSQEILQRRGGKFGIIWLAATRAAVLTKKDYYSVHVAKLCNDLLQHITLRVSLHGAKQRFSLYLSSQLMFGITKVHGKQADYLLVEVQRLHRQFSSTRLLMAESVIDDPFQLPKSSRSTAMCTLPSPDLSQFSGAWHQEMMTTPPHFFEEDYLSYSGTMRDSHAFKSPDRPISPIQELEDVSNVQPHIVNDVNDITMKEEEPIITGDFQIGEMDDFTGLIGDKMEEELASVPLPEELMASGDGDRILTSPQQEGKMWTIEEATGKLLLSPIGTSKKAEKTSKRTSADEASISSDVEKPAAEKGSSDEGHPEFKTPQSPSGHPVDVPILRLAELHEQDSTPLSAPKRGRKRRRQLLFVDLKTQLSKSEIRSSMEDYEDITERDILVNPDPLPGVKELFSEPARKAAKMSPVLVDIWKEGTNVDPRPEDDTDGQVWSLDYLREPVNEPGLTSPEYDLPEVPQLGRGDVSTERLRAQTSKGDDSRISSKMDDTPASLNITDASRLSQSREGSRQGSFIAESGFTRLRRAEESIEEERLASHDESMTSVLPQLDELLIDEGKELPLIEESLQTETLDPKAVEMSTSEDEGREIPQEQLYQKISELTSDEQETSFQELVPFSTYRKVAAKIFAACLEYAKDGLITVTQRKPFADILISRGPRMAV